MSVIESRLNPRSEEFKANALVMQRLVDDLNAKLAEIALGGGEGPRAKHLARGKLLPRDRVGRLLDPGAPFLEIGQLAACDMYEGEVPGAGIIAGIGRVSGRQVMIVSSLIAGT